MNDPIRFSVPATCANLGPGFGVLGVAVDIPLHITVEEMEESGHQVIRHGEMSHAPEDPRHDALLRAMHAAAEQFEINLPEGLQITAENKIPAFAGLGTNSASFAAGFGVAVRFAEDAPPADTLTDLLVQLGGTATHGGAALYGGLVAACPVQTAHETISHRVFRYSLSDQWIYVIACPQIHIGSASTRRVLPPSLPHGVVKRTSGRLLGLLHALATADEDLVRKCLLDEVHVPFRIGLAPGMKAAARAAEEAGAAGATIAGTGPALVALTTDRDRGEEIGKAMTEAFQKEGTEVDLRLVRGCDRGALQAVAE